ncbi:unnamed protein product [Ilex paraguariensis]|uniref:Epidermal patterning factor-like protein n=1 Tax=Ilex paraguariensis TaxID=185542 RepID=A0ABC8UFZ6_9AQUA
MMSLVSVTSRPFPSHDDKGVPPGMDQSAQSLQTSLSSKEGRKNVAEMSEKASCKGVSRIGSSPPSCDNKCYGCSPCEATQVPTTTSRVGVQYANYEPEGWKCKCGPTLYSP